MKNMKKKLIIMLSTCLVASTAGAMGMLSASADTGVDANRFAMGELATGGVASIRVVEPRGLRFVAEIGSNIYADLMKEENGVEKKMGMFIVPYTYLSDATKFSDGATGVSEKNYENITTKIDCVFYDSANDALENKIYQKGDYYYANGVIGDLYLKNYDRAFVGIAYIAETSNDITTYTFTEIDETVSRTATFVAEAAYQAAASSSAAQAVIEEYVIGAHLYERELLTETVSVENGVRTVTYIYNGENYSTLKDVKEVANVSFEIALDKESATIHTGETLQLTASVTESEEEIGITKKVLWKSSNEDVVTVDANGKVTYVGVGTATITASFLGKTAECEVSAMSDSEKEVAELLQQKTTTHSVRQFYTVDFAAEVVDSDTFGKTMPNGTKWLTKYNATLGATPGTNQWGAIAQLLATDLTSFAEKSVLANSYVGFWIYTDIQDTKYTTVKIDKFVSNAAVADSASAVTLKDADWTYVEFSLSDILTDANVVKTLYITAKYEGKPNGDFNETLYIAGFDIYKTSRMQEKTIAELLSSKTVAASNAESWYTLGATGSVVDSTLVATPDGKGYNWLAQFSVKYTRDKATPKGWGAIAQLKQEDVLIINDDVDTLKDGYVGFYVYTALTDADFDKVQVEVYSGAFGRSGAKATQVLTSGEWTYVEFALSDFVTDNGDGTVTIKDLCIAVYYNPTTNDHTKTTFDEQTLYIAGFDIYKESKQN